MTCIIEVNSIEEPHVYQIIQDKICDHFGYTLTVSIGEIEDRVDKVYQSFYNAKENIHIGRALFGDGHILEHEDMIIYKLLWQSHKYGTADCVYRRKLEKLKEYDKKKDTEYYGTLEAYIANDFNMKKTSRKLYIHYNTMKQRMNTIKEMIEFDYSDMNKMLLMALSLKFDQMDKSIQQDNHKR
ncbi:MAG: helix-turn-helix domain-containing protein, partial [Tissierellia bacterium]|nr:helix-turn-helix domain-containing protein [Tissierellia bacterium]